MKKGKLFIIIAPSGAGKTSLVAELVKRNKNIRVSISHTTRPLRPGEQDGIDYYFIDKSEFLEMLSDGDFLESAEVYGNHYGTSQRWVNKQLEGGLDVILEIDWQGAEQIRNLFPESCSIFILPPSIKALTERLQERAQDDKGTIESRMEQAREVIEHVADADYAVVNDQFEDALADIRAIVRAKSLTVISQDKALGDLLQDLAHQ